MIHHNGPSDKLLLVAALFFSILSPLLLAQPALQGWTTDGVTAFQLVAVDRGPTMTTFSLKNVSGRTITAYAATVGRGGEQYYDSFASQASVAPNGVRTIRISSQQDLSAPDRLLHLLAVIFDDGTGEGGTPQINFILMKRLGRTLETERIHSVLKRTVLGRDNLSRRGISSLTTDIGSLPESPHAALSSLAAVSIAGISASQVTLADKHSSFGFLGGVRETREGALRKLAEFQQTTSAVISEDAFLSQMADDYSRLSVACQDTLRRARKGIPQ